VLNTVNTKPALPSISTDERAVSRHVGDNDRSASQRDESKFQRQYRSPRSHDRDSDLDLEDLTEYNRVRLLVRNIRWTSILYSHNISSDGLEFAVDQQSYSPVPTVPVLPTVWMSEGWDLVANSSIIKYLEVEVLEWEDDM